MTVTIRSSWDISDTESYMSDTGVYPTMSQGSTIRTMKRDDSGILLSPERTAEHNIATQPMDPLTGLPSSQPYRAGSPMSVRSDDTDLLLGEYAKLLAPSEGDRSSEGGKSSSTTRLLAETTRTYPIGGSVGSGESVTTLDALMAGEPGLTLGTMSTGTVTSDDTMELTTTMVMTRTREITTLVRTSGDTEEVLSSSTQERRTFDTYSTGTLDDSPSPISIDIDRTASGSHERAGVTVQPESYTDPRTVPILSTRGVDMVDRGKGHPISIGHSTVQRPTTIQKPLSHTGAQDVSLVSPESGISDLGTPSAVRLSTLDTPSGELVDASSLPTIPEIRVGDYYSTSSPDGLSGHRAHPSQPLTEDFSETDSQVSSQDPSSKSYKVTMN